MTAVQYVKNLLENNWESAVSGREKDVPKPEIYLESAENLRRVNLDQSDVVFVRDGGTTQYTPKSFGWAQEEYSSPVTIDARTTGEAGSVPGRERLWGYRGVGNLSANEAERYGGLQGEIKRILDEVRKGDQEYDLVLATAQNDLSGEMGGQVWRALTEVSLDVKAKTIDSST